MVRWGQWWQCTGEVALAVVGYDVVPGIGRLACVLCLLGELGCWESWESMSSQHKGSPYKFDVVAVNVRCRDREQRLWCAVLAIDCAIVVVEIHGVQRRGCMFASVVASIGS